MNRRTLMLLAGAAPFTSALSQTQFPNRPIRVVIPFPSGSSTDVIVRRLGEHVSKTLGQPVVVESKPGASGLIAARAVLSGPKDGHTLFLGTNSTHAANLYLVKDLGYDPLKDFVPITQTTSNTLLLVVNADLPVRTVQEFVKYAKERPGKLSYGTGNSGGLVAVQLLKMKTGIDAVPINYQGTAQATTDLAAGRLEFMMVDPVVIRPFIQSGKVRVLGLSSKQRLPSMPEAKPLAESGISDYQYASWGGLFGPDGTPPDVILRLNQAFTQALTDSSNEKFFGDLGIIPSPSRPEVFQAFVQDQVKVWGELVKEAKLTPQ
ncbi:tripartite tricarboxylate transporter substrate binding protein [Ramlibacter sp. 2FC]|uniref:Bug family tripartite tricarboxylate transporter substrate binding protein n=1 Tax=Ramlibacter sp. 2FC TaxID=2502188 RepID=UPI0014853320|nr:tripartite tricarboxylate transporter substrate binding protein [Ramlibacter sp. 2FC]